jgi:glycerophosphoryl diester phosphodiesterase
MNHAAPIHACAAHAVSPVPMANVEVVLFDAGDILYHRPERAARLAGFLDRHANGRRVTKSAVKELKLLSWRGGLPRADYYRALLETAGITDARVLDRGAAMLVAEQHEVTFFPGAAKLLHGLKRRGFKLGVITNTHETTAEKLDWFARIGIDGLWDVFVNSCETGFIKPERGIYQTALDALELEAGSAVFVAHSAKEIEGARAVGLRTIAFNPDAPDVGADAHAPTYGALADLVCEGPDAARRGRAPRSGPGGLPTIAAHRGGALLWPENTLTAFRGAIGLHADLIETDIHLSADGLPIIHHDPTLDRTTEGTGPLGAFSAAELSRIRIKDTPGENLFTLDRLLFMLEPSETDLRLELKLGPDGAPYPGLERVAADMLQRFAMLARTTVSSFDIDSLARFAGLARPAGLIHLVRHAVLEGDGLQSVISRAKAADIPELAIHVRSMTQDVIATVQAAGLRIGAYAVRTPDEARRMLDLRISTFTTDIPDQALFIRRQMISDAALNLAER